MCALEILVRNRKWNENKCSAAVLSTKAADNLSIFHSTQAAVTENSERNKSISNIIEHAREPMCERRQVEFLSEKLCNLPKRGMRPSVRNKKKKLEGKERETRIIYETRSRARKAAWAMSELGGRCGSRLARAAAQPAQNRDRRSLIISRESPFFQALEAAHCDYLLNDLNNLFLRTHCCIDSDKIVCQTE